jgi:putative endonuclease
MAAEVMDMTAAEVEDEGQRLAGSYLERRGFTLTESDWKDSDGKRGIVAEGDDGTVIVFVHTKLDLSGDDTMPELAVTSEMQKGFRTAALQWAASNPGSTGVRVDVIAISIVGERTARLRHLIGAYEWAE